MNIFDVLNLIGGLYLFLFGAVCTIDAADNNMNIHQSLIDIKHNSPYFKEEYEKYLAKYAR